VVTSDDRNAEYGRLFRVLRLHLGQTTDEVALRGKPMSEKLLGQTVSKFELYGAAGRSRVTFAALAAGVGLSWAALESYLEGEMSLDDALKRSTVTTDPAVRRGLPASRADICLLAASAAVPASSIAEHSADPCDDFPYVPAWVVNCLLSARSGSGIYRGLVG